MGEKRVIEEQHVNVVYNDDYALKDSATNDTTAILWSDIKAWINSGMATESDLDNAIANFASEYSTSTSYAVGDFCVFDGVLYECVGSTTGDWDSTKWEETTVGEVLTDNSDGIAKLVSSIATEWRANESYSNGTYVMYEGELYVCFVNGSTVGQFKKNTEWLHRTVNSMVTKVIRMIAQRFYASTVSPPSLTPYSKGDLVWYSQPYHEDELYICKQDLPNGDTEWVPEHWDKVTDISGLSKYLVGLIAEAGQIDDVQVKTTGDYESVVDENKVAKIDLSSMTAYGEVPNLPQPIATFNDGSDNLLKSLKVGIEPVQDLHGYDHPWAGGAGKNKLKVTATTQEISGVTFTVNEDGTVKANGTATDAIMLVLNTTGFTLPSGNYKISAGVSGTSETTYFVCSNYASGQRDYTNDGAFTSDGSLAYRPSIYIVQGVTLSNVVFKPMIRLATETDATFAPYSNICPISGWDEVNVTRRGKNLLGGEALAEEFEGAVGYSIDTTNKTFTYLRSKSEWTPNVKFKENTSYTFIITYTGGRNNCFRVVYTDGTTGQLDLEQATEKTVYLVTTPSNKTIKAFDVAWLVNSLVTVYYDESGIFEGAITRDDFEPYNGRTYTIYLDGTRYGGTLDVVSGVLTVDRAIVDMGDLFWNYGSSSKVFTASVSGIKSGTYTDENLISSIYPVTPLPYSQFEYGLRYDSPTSIGVKNPLYTDATTFKSAMSGVQLVYNLATPLTIQLTPTAVKSLLGANNIWTDTGDINDCIYQRDLNTTINDIIARIEALEA